MINPLAAQVLEAVAHILGVVFTGIENAPYRSIYGMRWMLRSFCRSWSWSSSRTKE